MLSFEASALYFKTIYASCTVQHTGRSATPPTPPARRGATLFGVIVVPDIGNKNEFLSTISVQCRWNATTVGLAEAVSPLGDKTCPRRDCMEAGESSANTAQKPDDSTLDAPLWVPDFASSSCQLCGNEFWFLSRRHHCRKVPCCAPCTQSSDKASRSVWQVSLRLGQQGTHPATVFARGALAGLQRECMPTTHRCICAC